MKSTSVLFPGALLLLVLSESTAAAEKPRMLNPFAGSPAAVEEGRKLYQVHGCSACHGVQGGGGMGKAILDDTWAFDLGTRQWTNLTPELRPAGRMLASSFADGERRFVVFGGATDAGRVNETWAFDLAQREWTRLEIPDPPPPREAAMSALVEGEGIFLVFGGRGDARLNDLWELRRAATEGNGSYRSLSSSSRIVSGGVR